MTQHLTDSIPTPKQSGGGSIMLWKDFQQERIKVKMSGSIYGDIEDMKDATRSSFTTSLHVLERPGQSPDSNYTEHFWKNL